MKNNVKSLVLITATNFGQLKENVQFWHYFTSVCWFSSASVCVALFMKYVAVLLHNVVTFPHTQHNL